ncbi:MAG TPA: TIGR03435 family protein [Candidatus Sulfopaludibacter sp.]|jgi:uncharacterized protein (TIGR03435 family)|nr:TIGR03435 family protein [Candidatus Sulfopaludibacter sp.]
MRSSILLLACLTVVHGQTPHVPSFEVASVKPASPSASAITCSGGPGTSDPGTWRCSNVPLGFLITQAYGFEAYQFRPNDPCCRGRFDFNAKVPDGATKEQFHLMIQNLLTDRFHLKLRHEKKEMPTYQLTLGDGGAKMKPSAANAPAETEDPWAPPEFTLGKDGYPVFPAGRGGLAGAGGHYHWVASNLSVEDMVKTLSFHLGRPVIDATRLTGKYDIDLKWWIDVSWLLERAGHPDEAKDLPDLGRPGPTLMRAVQDQLGLKLVSGKGLGDLVVIDHLDKVPTEN